MVGVKEKEEEKETKTKNKYLYILANTRTDWDWGIIHISPNLHHVGCGAQTVRMMDISVASTIESYFSHIRSP